MLHSCLVGEHATTSQSFDQLRPGKQTARTRKKQWFHVQVPHSVPWYSYLRDQICADIVGRRSCQWVIIYCNCYRLGHLEDGPPLSMGMGGRIMLVVCKVWVGRTCQGVCMTLLDLTIHDQHYTSLISFHAFCSETLSIPTRYKVLGAMLVCFGEPDYLREVVKCKAVPGTDS